MSDGPGAASARLPSASPAHARREPPPPPMRKRVGPRQRSALISWAAFTATFATVRAVTHAVKNPNVPARDVKAGGVHLHHYLWGIGLLGLSGGAAVHGSDSIRVNPAVAAGYGIGGALIIDELASLVHLDDVYWSKQGRWSVALGVGLIGVTGLSLAGIPVVLRHRRHPAGEHATTEVTPPHDEPT